MQEKLRTPRLYRAPIPLLALSLSSLDLRHFGPQWFGPLALIRPPLRPSRKIPDPPLNIGLPHGRPCLTFPDPSFPVLIFRSKYDIAAL